MHIGDGVIGQTFLEGRIILLTDVSPDYITITSGLGQARPRCVVIVPMQQKDRVQGIVEVASFDEYLAHHINFLEKVGASVAFAVFSLQQIEQIKLTMGHELRAKTG